MHPEFEQAPGLLYLNHAAVSPWPLRTAEAVRAFAAENQARGSAGYPRWLRTEARLRERLAWLINAPSTADIALLKNTSEALSVVAYGIDWAPGDEVITFTQEFPSNRIVWESLAPWGVVTRLVDLHAAGRSPEEGLMAACGGRTRLVSCSSVQYADGTRIDLEAIGRFCRDRGILFCVDAIQSLGALAFDAERCHADFVVADGHKWMMGPEGVALFYARAAVRPRLKLRQFGWHMVEGAGDFDRTDWRPAADGTRFECGSPNMLGIHALEASLALVQETGMEEIEARVRRNTRALTDLVDATTGLRLVTGRDPARASGIVTFRIEGREPQPIQRALAERGVVCACRGGGIRFSPHFYQERETLEAAFERLIDVIKQLKK